MQNFLIIRHADRRPQAILRQNHYRAMSSHITVERVETKQTLIEVDAKTPEEAFREVKNGKGQELGTVKESELLIRDPSTPAPPRK